MEDLRQKLDTDAIRGQLQDGSYFRRARQWFDVIYHRPIAERSYFIVITILAVVTIFFSTLVYLSMQPLVRTVPYTLYSTDIVEELPVIKPLKQSAYEDLNLSIARFLLEDYVTLREGYRYDVSLLEYNFNRVRGTTSEGEFLNYQAQINPENASSPFNKYGRNGTREIFISTSVIDFDIYPQMAQVYFATKTQANNRRDENSWIANITFRLPELRVNQKTNAVMQWNEAEQRFETAEEIVFKVDRYEVQEITQLRR